MPAPDLRENAKFWLDPQLDHLELLRATYYTYAFAPHVHDTYAIGVTDYGAQVYTHQRSKRWIMPAGSVAVVHPGEVHTSRAASDQGWAYRMFYPQPALLSKVASDLAHRPQNAPFFPAPVILDADLAAHIHHLHRAFEDPATTALERESRLLWVVGLLILRHAAACPALRPAQPEPGYVRLVQEYLDQSFSQPVTLDQLAGLVSVSPFHLLRMFRRTTGLSPHAYLLHVRIERAKQCLRQGMPIASAAAEVGFVDQSHFTKSFKRVVGVSPGQYRA